MCFFLSRSRGGLGREDPPRPGLSQNDPYDDGLPPITGPSVFDADEREAKTLLNAKDDGDDFWRDDVF